jgi:tetratricopeptide (TPR) repeat protein
MPAASKLLPTLHTVILATLATLAILPTLATAQVEQQCDGTAPKRFGHAHAWEDTVTIPTYPTLPDDVNPHFQAIEGKKIYPYTMQDNLSTTKVDQDYRVVYLENKYLRVMCIPEIGGRIQSVLDKTTGEEMFHRNNVIKPGLIAMRGAWVSGGIEWNHGPEGHTVTSYSPVDVAAVEHDDGSASLLISYVEFTSRKRWRVQLTLEPDKAYLYERIKIWNPTDGNHSYYFWNNTAFNCHEGTRFIYPMTLGTDHNGNNFFTWPTHEGKDLTWLKNYDPPTSVFAYGCTFDFFGAYDVFADRGIVAIGDHRILPGKKAWTWGQAESGLASQASLTDEDGAYIEVQTGPLLTQADFDMLKPHESVAWEEWWYPVHGLGQGYEFATKHIAAERIERDDGVEFRFMATGDFPRARITMEQDGERLVHKRAHLSPLEPVSLFVPNASGKSVNVSIADREGNELLDYASPLHIPVVEQPLDVPAKPEPEWTAQDWFEHGWERDTMLNPVGALEAYNKALALNPKHADSLVAKGVILSERGLDDEAEQLFKRAAKADPANEDAKYHVAKAPTTTSESAEETRVHDIDQFIALAASADADARKSIGAQARIVFGEDAFNAIEAAAQLMKSGQNAHAVNALRTSLAGFDDPTALGPLPHYYLAYLHDQLGDASASTRSLQQAAACSPDYVFPSRPETISALQFALAKNPNDARAHLYLGNLFAGLFRLDEAVSHWESAANIDPTLSVAHRNLAAYHLHKKKDRKTAATHFARAIEARPYDQTLSRDLARIHIQEGRKDEAITVLEAMEVRVRRRGDVANMLASTYVDTGRYNLALDLLATSTFSNWEGNTQSWRTFVRARLGRGQSLMAEQRYAEALTDFEAALTYPANLGVGRAAEPEEAEGQYHRGRALQALGREADARAAWQAGTQAKPDAFAEKCKEALAN